MSRKHIVIARVLRWTGVAGLLNRLPTRSGLVVLNYHRVGDASGCDFDRSVMSACVDQLDRQITLLKRRLCLVGFSEALDLLRHPARMTRPFVLLTFDDGYLDDYEVAFPVLRSHGCSAVFFVVPQMVGTALLPWWDEISFLVRNSRKSRLEMPPPMQFQVDLGPNREPAIGTVLRFFKSSANRHPKLFLEQLREQAEVEIPPQPRRFMNWPEICDLAQYGMEIGSHSLSHPILSRLPAAEQLQELVNSKQEIEAHTGTRTRAFAYPVGSRSAFTETTRRLVLEAGYEAAFSFFGGMNSPHDCQLTNVRRMGPWASSDSLAFSTEIDLLTRFGPLLSKVAANQSAWRTW
jgi:peptidoglycan/xylan/chitin deacetylase (PgdA/CDA1 family)